MSTIDGNQDAILDDDGDVDGTQASPTEYEDGKPLSIASSFFRGDTTTFYPRREDLHKPEAIERYFLRGWVPATSPFTGGEKVLVLGGEITAPLVDAARDHGLVALMPDEAAALSCRHAEGLAATLSAAGGPLAASVAEADLIVLCLAERSPTHASHAEHVADLEAAYGLLREARPLAHIVFAVSPLPPAHVESRLPTALAVTAAKATVRSAVDEVYRGHIAEDDRLGYFPAHELINVAFNYPYEADRRTPAPHMLAMLAAAFARAYGVGFDDDALAAAHLETRAADVAAGTAMRALADAANRQGTALAAAGDWPDEVQLNADLTLHDFVFKGLVPDAPFINADRTVIAFGSCFANNISRYLNTIGYNVATKRDAIAYVSRMGDGIVNTYAIRQQFEWAWENKIPQVELWHDYKALEFGYDERVRLRTKELFDIGDLFIITLGLSEVWHDEVTGEVFWRAVPADRYDPSRHKFRMVPQHESLANIEAIYRLIKAHRPEAQIVFTVSPIPLMATFRGKACAGASAVSKAILRSAIDEFFARHADDRNLFYFPAYEVITSCFHEPFTGDMRHPLLYTILYNMKVFERYYCDSGVTDKDIADFMTEVRYRDYALNSDERAAVYALLYKERDEWQGDGQVPCIESVARLKARGDAVEAREQERAVATAARQEEAEAKRDAAKAAREAAAEARRLEAERRRQDAEAARLGRARAPR